MDDHQTYLSRFRYLYVYNANNAKAFHLCKDGRPKCGTRVDIPSLEGMNEDPREGGWEPCRRCFPKGFNHA